MRRPRGLTPEEDALWRRVASTVKPLNAAPNSRKEPGRAEDGSPDGVTSENAGLTAPPTQTPVRTGPPPALAGEQPKPRRLDRHGLDSGWDRRLAKGLVDPDFTLDLHGATLDAAHARLLHGLSQAQALGARLVLLIAGRPRPAEAADRGRTRGAIRAHVIDWIAASQHALDVAAIRTAHRRHGGPGALYVVLRRRR